MIVCVTSPVWGATTQSDWPSYNRTLTSERYSSLDQINARNVATLKIQCTYDTKQEIGFQTGLVQIDGAVFATPSRMCSPSTPIRARRIGARMRTFRTAR